MSISDELSNGTSGNHDWKWEEYRDARDQLESAYANLEISQRARANYGTFCGAGGSYFLGCLFALFVKPNLDKIVWDFSLIQSVLA